MKRIIHRQMIKIGLLTVLFLYPPLAKSFHVSHEQLCISESANRSHNDNDCPVCHFQYTSCIGTELFKLNPVPFYYSFKKLFYEEKEYDTTLFSCFLRGPPSFS
jgi:hypothetical protein